MARVNLSRQYVTQLPREEGLGHRPKKLVDQVINLEEAKTKSWSFFIFIVPHRHRGSERHDLSKAHGICELFQLEFMGNQA